METVRGLAFAVAFYPWTLLCVLSAIVAAAFGSRPTMKVVLTWVQGQSWLAEHLLGIRTRVEGRIPDGPHLIAAKHQSMFETLEMVRIGDLPVIVMKREL